MKKYLLLALLASTSVHAQDDALPPFDGTYTLNGIERAFIPFKNYYGQLVDLEVKVRTHLATNPLPVNSLAHNVLERVWNERIGGVPAYTKARLKQKTLMKKLMSFGVEDKTITTLNEFYNDGNIQMIVNILERKCDSLVAEACFEAGLIAKEQYKSKPASDYFEKAHNADVKSSKYLAYLGELQLYRGDLAAEQTFKQGLALEDSSHKYKILLHLADFYGFAKKIDERNATLQKITDDAGMIISLEDRRILTKATIQLAKYVYENDKPKEALALADKVVAMGLTHFPDAEVENIAVGYHNLASIYADNGRKDDAETLYKIAVKIGEAYYIGRNHSKLAQRYFNLAGLYNHEKRYDEAMLYQAKGLKIIEARNIEGSLALLARWYASVGITQVGLKNTREAELFFLQAKAEFAKAKDNKSEAYAHFAEHYSEHLKATGRAKEAGDIKRGIGAKT